MYMSLASDCMIVKGMIYVKTRMLSFLLAALMSISLLTSCAETSVKDDGNVGEGQTDIVQEPEKEEEEPVVEAEAVPAEAY